MKSRLDPGCMLQAMDCFIEAATSYAKDKAFALERKCLDNASLIQLQVRENAIPTLKNKTTNCGPS